MKNPIKVEWRKLELTNGLEYRKHLLEQIEEITKNWDWNEERIRKAKKFIGEDK